MAKSNNKTKLSSGGAKTLTKFLGSTKKAKTTNYALGSREMTLAAKNALTRAGKSFSSVATISQRFSHFAAYAKQEFGAKIMEQLTRNIVIAYAKTLVEKVNSGELSPATAQNYLSAVNVILSLARGDSALRVKPVSEAGFPSRSGIAKINKSVSLEAHNSAINKATEVISIMLELQRNLGLRFEESAKIDAKKVLSGYGLGKNFVTITDGTKGGRIREVPIFSYSQIQALQRAASYQAKHHQRSMIPKAKSYKDFRNDAYNQIRNLGINFHGERHAYAQERYKQLMGFNAPVVEGTTSLANLRFEAFRLGVPVSLLKEKDFLVRLQISTELGHCRISITRSYLG
jgi:hypothetical protein